MPLLTALRATIVKGNIMLPSDGLPVTLFWREATMFFNQCATKVGPGCSKHCLWTGTQDRVHDVSNAQIASATDEAR